MATIQKRKKKNGTYSCRFMIRQSDGFPAAYRTFPKRQEAGLSTARRGKTTQGGYQCHKLTEKKTAQSSYRPLHDHRCRYYAKKQKRHSTSPKLVETQLSIISPPFLGRPRFFFGSPLAMLFCAHRLFLSIDGG